MRFVGLIFLVMTMAGCRYPPSTSQGLSPPPLASLASTTPTNPAGRIAAANLIVVTREDSQFSYALSGDKASRIVDAISSGRALTGPLIPRIQCDWELRFYEGTNFLASVYFAESFYSGDGELLYKDESGALGKLYDEILERTAPPYKTR